MAFGLSWVSIAGLTNPKELGEDGSCCFKPQDLLVETASVRLGSGSAFGSGLDPSNDLGYHRLWNRLSNSSSAGAAA